MGTRMGKDRRYLGLLTSSFTVFAVFPGLLTLSR